MALVFTQVLAIPPEFCAIRYVSPYMICVSLYGMCLLIWYVSPYTSTKPTSHASRKSSPVGKDKKWQLF